MNFIKDIFYYRRLLKNRHIVIPVKTGIQYSCEEWIPAFAGMTAKIELFRSLYMLQQ